jgi:hypothetical protein
LRSRGGGGKAAKDRRGQGGSGVHPDGDCRGEMDDGKEKPVCRKTDSRTICMSSTPLTRQ